MPEMDYTDLAQVATSARPVLIIEPRDDLDGISVATYSTTGDIFGSNPIYNEPISSLDSACVSPHILGIDSAANGRLDVSPVEQLEATRPLLPL